MIYAPFNDHVLDYWNKRNDDNVLFLFYEDMKKSMRNVVEETMTFLGKKYSQQEIDTLCKHLSVESMRANPSCNNDTLVERAKSLNENGKIAGNFQFIRKGEVGSFQDEFSKETNIKFDKFLEQPNLRENHFYFRF